MTINKMDALANITSALAKSPKRLRGARGASAGAARMEALTAKLATAKVALDAADRASERQYRHRVGKLKTVGVRYNAVKRELEECEWGSERSARLMSYARLLTAIRNDLFKLPILPSDLSPNGRFARKVRHLDMTVGMVSADVEDIVAQAVEYCLIDPKGESTVDGMPTIGAMYRNIKRAYHMELDRFRAIKRGLGSVYSLDELMALAPDAVETQAARLESIGYGYAELNAFAPLSAVSDMEASSLALTLDAQERRRMEARAMAERAERDDAITEAATPAELEADTFAVDRAAIRAIINGATLAEVAEALGVSEATVTRRLLALEGVASTRHSHNGYWSDDAEPVWLDYAAATATTPPKAVTAPRPGWSTSRDGTRASAPVVTRLSRV